MNVTDKCADPICQGEATHTMAGLHGRILICADHKARVEAAAVRAGLPVGPLDIRPIASRRLYELAEEAGVSREELRSITFLEFAMRLRAARDARAAAPTEPVLPEPGTDATHCSAPFCEDPCDPGRWLCPFHYAKNMRGMPAPSDGHAAPANYARDMRDAGRGHLLRNGDS